MRSFKNLHYVRWKTAGFLSVLLFTSVQWSAAQIRVLYPTSLASQLKPHGSIWASTAAFGTPYWGDVVIGKIAYAESKGRAYCSGDDYDLPPLVSSANISSELTHGAPADSTSVTRLSSTSAVQRPRIVLVHRGVCSFVRKVQVAQDTKNAAAVIVIDYEASAEEPFYDVRSVLMADDGLGYQVRVPSLLISYRDGTAMIDTLNKGQDILVELNWDIPDKTVVDVDLWMSPGFASSIKFLEAFAPFARTLKDLITFRPHYSVFPLLFDDAHLCWDPTAQFCSTPPDWPGSTATGKAVIEESLRQICLGETTKTSSLRSPSKGYSEIWWNYIELAGSRCLKPDVSLMEDAVAFDAGCSYDLMKEVGANVTVVKECFKDMGYSHLFFHMLNQAWSPTALMINNARVFGSADAVSAAKAICTGFKTRPSECATLDKYFELQGAIVSPVHELMSRVAKLKNDHEDTVSEMRRIYILSTVGASAVATLAAFMIYKCIAARKLKNELRYEVFEEVKSQLGSLRDAGSGSFILPPSASFSIAQESGAALRDERHLGSEPIDSYYFRQHSADPPDADQDKREAPSLLFCSDNYGKESQKRISLPTDQRFNVQ